MNKKPLIETLAIVVGLSGAGKSSALNAFSDCGFYPIENIPIALLPELFEHSLNSLEKYSRIVLLLDLDSAERVKELDALQPLLEASAERVEVAFLDCDTPVILRRFSETRRPHPGFDAQRDKSLEDTIQRERDRLAGVKRRADVVFDTTDLNVHDLRRGIRKYVEDLSSLEPHSVRVNFVSFGFKNGIPIDCDLIVDVRFLSNPYFVEELREKTGLEKEVRDYVLETAEAREFIKRYSELLEFLIPKYVHEGKSYLNVGIGCTGGKHRSVAISEKLKTLIKPEKCIVSCKHRDIPD